MHVVRQYMSDRTRELYDFQMEYSNSSKLGLNRQIKGIVRPGLINYGAAILHQVEAIYKAVSFVFLWVKSYFLPVNPSLIEKQRVEAKMAYCAGVNSFCAAFGNPSNLSSNVVEEPQHNSSTSFLSTPFHSLNVSPIPPLVVPLETDLNKINEKSNEILGKAQSQVMEENKKIFDLHQVPSDLNLYGQELVSSCQTIYGFKVGVCSYHPIDEKAKGTHLALGFDLKIADTVYPIQLFGIFDAIGGPDAALYLKDKLQKMISNQLKEQNKTGLNRIGIWNALIQTFVNLDQSFKSELMARYDTNKNEYIIHYGSTPLVVMIINNELWTMNLGNGRAILIDDDGYKPVTQLSIEGNPENEQRKGYVSENGLRAEISIIPLKSKCRIFLGSEDFFKQSTTKGLEHALAICLSENPENIVHKFAYSVSKNETKKDFSCMLIEAGQIISRRGSDGSYSFCSLSQLSDEEKSENDLEEESPPSPRSSDGNSSDGSTIIVEVVQTESKRP